MRESAKRSRHEADVVRAGGHFVPLVYDTYGTMGEGAEAWFRGLVAVAPIEPPEWMAASGACLSESLMPLPRRLGIGRGTRGHSLRPNGPIGGGD